MKNKHASIPENASFPKLVRWRGCGREKREITAGLSSGMQIY
jgi:hypothetical protein